jgi:hypothetical protein
MKLSRIEARPIRRVKMFYMHKETGSIDNRDGWIASYDTDELDARKLTAEQAFGEDEGETLFQITPERTIAGRI